ncbi:MAG TPA: DEAD/DEAH box helicase, partial [Acidimicrobiales bacterium]
MTGGPDEALAALRSRRAYRDQVVHVERVPGRPARYRQPAAPLPPAAEQYVERRGIELYTHQARALDAWRAGDDVLLATRTASGKSLAFDLAMADALAADPDATALYLFPTKALTHDQLAHLEVFDAALGLGARPMAYDGDTPQDQRARARRRARLICTNPYGLHEYLPQNRSLAAFLSGLAIVVVDEAHRYRGLFGSNVALVLRRLQRICARLGASPRFVLASGTIANPAEHGEALIGRPVTVVDDDGAGVGERVVALWDSMADPNRSAITQAAGIVATLARRHCRTLCFTGSRLGAELVAATAAEQAPGAAISPYRAGFTPAERREIERQLRGGQLDAVVSTNALELGIDIGGLDAVVLTGYPGTIASTWQQIGRAGRAGQDSLAVLVAGDDALDQYFVRRPQLLFSAPVERAVTSLGNPNILTGQVLCAAAELPLGEDDGARFGAGYAASVADLEGEGLVSRAPVGLVFAGGFRPASVVRLD